MKHLGDITKISGRDVPAADVVIGGSPCQDLSIAGKRAGLAGERSGLFMEQIRLIKEMREHDRNTGRTDVYVRPRFMVWENVPGAFSSNKGEDFRAVLEETARVVRKDAVIPRYEEGWRTSGCILGDGWSIAWRVLDAQFWGVPQRRCARSCICLKRLEGDGDMREILFRGKQLDNGAWVVGSLVEMTGPINKGQTYIMPQGDGLSFEHYGEHGTCSIGSFVEVDPATVGQYTGQKDRTGKKIFDGDVVRAETYHDCGQCGEKREATYVVNWDEKRAMFYPFNIVDGDYLRLETFEVIDNKHDNPELLRGWRQ